jgi:capsular polysaccharide transport system permease protein
MSDEGITQTPTVFSSKERAALVAKALSEAARRARFSTKRRRNLTASGFRARRGERLFKLLRLWSFIAVVVVPSLVGGAYFLFMASDQYVAEARFTLRGGLPPSMDSIGSLTGAPPVLIIQDTQIIMNYLVSRSLVESMNKSIDFESLYQKSWIDDFSRLKLDRSIEKVTAYWKHQLDLSVQMPAGIVVMTVRAFTADDAVTIANAALQASDKLVNDMNDQMRNDAVALAETERTRAQNNLAKARSALEKARNDEGMLSAEATSTGLLTLMTQVQGDQLKLQQEYDTQRRYVRADAPQLRGLVSKLDAAKNEVTKLQRQMTDQKAAADGKGRALSGSMSRLDYATLENTIAEKIYAGSLAALEHAHIASETKLMYINTFVKPVAAEEAKYPKRGLDILILVSAALAIWGMLVGVLALVRGSMG